MQDKADEVSLFKVHWQFLRLGLPIDDVGDGSENYPTHGKSASVACCYHVEGFLSARRLILHLSMDPQPTGFFSSQAQLFFVCRKKAFSVMRLVS